MNGKPWFKFYPEKWLSDGGVRELSHAAKGLYIQMIACCWSEGGMDLGGEWPEKFRDLPEKYRRVFGDGSESDMTRLWRRAEGKLQTHFVKQSDGKWWNKRLLAEFSTFCVSDTDESRVDDNREDSLGAVNEKFETVTKEGVDALQVVRRTGGVADRLCGHLGNFSQHNGCGRKHRAGDDPGDKAFLERMYKFT